MEYRTYDNREQLHKAIFQCKKCPDAGFSMQRVQPPWDPSRGSSATKKWAMIIGQAPGITEFERSKKTIVDAVRNASTDKASAVPIAFSGEAGQRLEQWFIEDAGFDQAQVRSLFAKTSIVKCYPGRPPKTKTDRKPSRREIEFCTPFLYEQIRLYNPAVLIPMGTVAVKWFFPEVGKLAEIIGKKRNWQFTDKQFSVVCLPHSSNASNWWKVNELLRRKALGHIAALRRRAAL